MAALFSGEVVGQHPVKDELMRRTLAALGLHGRSTLHQHATGAERATACCASVRLPSVSCSLEPSRGDLASALLPGRTVRLLAIPPKPCPNPGSAAQK